MKIGLGLRLVARARTAIDAILGAGKILTPSRWSDAGSWQDNQTWKDAA